MVISFPLLMIYLALQVADGITTKLALSTPGLKEGNPLVGFAITVFGTNGGIIAVKGLGVILGVGVFLCGPPVAAAWGLGALNAVYAGVVAHNILELKEY